MDTDEAAYHFSEMAKDIAPDTETACVHVFAPAFAKELRREFTKAELAMILATGLYTAGCEVQMAEKQKDVERN